MEKDSRAHDPPELKESSRITEVTDEEEVRLKKKVVIPEIVITHPMPSSTQVEPAIVESTNCE